MTRQTYLSKFFSLFQLTLIAITEVVNEEEPKFSYINAITVAQDESVILEIICCDIVYDHHFHSWKIKHT